MRNTRKTATRRKLSGNGSACCSPDDRAQANCKCKPPRLGMLAIERAEEYARWFKTLSDPTRVRILNLLATNREPVCVCDIVSHFPVGQPTISHHLKILRASRFVLPERRGTFMYYRVNRHCLAEFPHAAELIMDV